MKKFLHLFYFLLVIFASFTSCSHTHTHNHLAELVAFRNPDSKITLMMRAIIEDRPDTALQCLAYGANINLFMPDGQSMYIHILDKIKSLGRNADLQEKYLILKAAFDAKMKFQLKQIELQASEKPCICEKIKSRLRLRSENTAVVTPISIYKKKGKKQHIVGASTAKTAGECIQQETDRKMSKYQQEILTAQQERSCDRNSALTRAAFNKMGYSVQPKHEKVQLTPMDLKTRFDASFNDNDKEKVEIASEDLRIRFRALQNSISLINKAEEAGVATDAVKTNLHVATIRFIKYYMDQGMHNASDIAQNMKTAKINGLSVSDIFTQAFKRLKNDYVLPKDPNYPNDPLSCFIAAMCRIVTQGSSSCTHEYEQTQRLCDAIRARNAKVFIQLFKDHTQIVKTIAHKCAIVNNQERFRIEIEQTMKEQVKQSSSSVGTNQKK